MFSYFQIITFKPRLLTYIFWNQVLEIEKLTYSLREIELFQMQNEARLLDYLRYWEYEMVPRLIYSGYYAGKNFYINVTEFIPGQYSSSRNTNRNKCINWQLILLHPIPLRQTQATCGNERHRKGQHHVSNQSHALSPSHAPQSLLGQHHHRW